MLVFFVGGVAAAAAVAATLEAVEAGTAAGHAAATAADDTPDNRKNDEASYDHGSYYWPPGIVSCERLEAEEGGPLLAVRSLHTIIPTRKGRLDIVGRLCDSSSLHAQEHLPRHTARHGDIDCRHSGDGGACVCSVLFLFYSSVSLSSSCESWWNKARWCRNQPNLPIPPRVLFSAPVVLS